MRPRAREHTFEDMSPITPHVLAWQYADYASAHQSRKNLAIHAAAVPLFIGGVAALVLTPAVSWRLAPIGLAAMAGALVAEGRGHTLERQPPAPLRGPLDFVVRFFVEQCVTFPRFVLRRGFSRAWRSGA